ncbi:sensor histidine kinase [Modestobacter sp. I12A-02628]|uniref:Sensor histidine kinase n=1 Tax=Goekera deserti TaxID=2497753 RepID=A0A7K3WBB3_9ACTN|nr:sensor histidine kinase [Goekera deserti]MPQ97491.1 sensor histidine kinase [Goekera deserti]NDI47906.1 sensor histidine kinase [Goekera deserti]NEL53654.1 sensor histidine kinase [Goekera deserti]
MIAWLRRFGWAAPWLFFLWFPVEDLVSTPRPGWAVALGGVGLLAFVAAYVISWTGPLADIADGGPMTPAWLQELGVWAVAVLGSSLAVGFGINWTGLCIYVSVAAAMVLPNRTAWWVTGVCSVVSAWVLLSAGAEGIGLLFLPGIAVLTGFAMRGTRYLVQVNGELRAAREELARTAIAEERLRFSRDLHDLLGHSLSLIVLKSELARRLGERDPAASLREMADVEQVARQALTEVREAVSGYRQVSVAQSLAEARSALSGAGIATDVPARLPQLPAEVDVALGWVVREATTNVLRHSGARRVTVRLSRAADAVELVVDDDGCGPTREAGSGLRGLRERVEALRGSLATSPAPGGGFRLTARVPVPEAAPVAAAAPSGAAR